MPTLPHWLTTLPRWVSILLAVQTLLIAFLVGVVIGKGGVGASISATSAKDKTFSIFHHPGQSNYLTDHFRIDNGILSFVAEPTATATGPLPGSHPKRMYLSEPFEIVEN